MSYYLVGCSAPVFFDAYPKEGRNGEEVPCCVPRKVSSLNKAQRGLMLDALKPKKLQAFETLAAARQWVASRKKESYVRHYSRVMYPNAIWQVSRYPIFEAEIAEGTSGKQVLKSVKRVYVGRMEGSFDVADGKLSSKRKVLGITIGKIGRSISASQFKTAEDASNRKSYSETDRLIED